MLEVSQLKLFKKGISKFHLARFYQKIASYKDNTSSKSLFLDSLS